MLASEYSFLSRPRYEIIQDNPEDISTKYLSSQSSIGYCLSLASEGLVEPFQITYERIVLLHPLYRLAACVRLALVV